MVANLTIGKKKWIPVYDQMCHSSEKAQSLKEDLLNLIDADTEAFSHVLNAYKRPQKTDEQISERNELLDEALKEASNIPFKTLKCCCEIMLCVKELAENGNPNSISDVGVGAEMAYAGAEGAALNVKINLKEINDIQYCQKMQKDTDSLIKEIRAILEVVRETVLQKINYD